MTWSVIGTPASYDNGGAAWFNTTFTWPTVASGDLAVIALANYENGRADLWLDPSGFTEQHNTVISGTGSTESRGHTYTKVCTGSESGSITVEKGAGGTEFATALFCVLRGAASLSVAAAPTVSAVDSATPIAAPQVSASTDEGLLLVLFDDSGVAMTEPGAVTAVIEGNANGTNHGGIYYENLSATGDTTAHSFSWSGSDNVIIASFRIAGVGFAGGGAPKGRMMMLGIG